MAIRSIKRLGVESLEARLNMSTLAGSVAEAVLVPSVLQRPDYSEAGPVVAGSSSAARAFSARFGDRFASLTVRLRKNNNTTTTTTTNTTTTTTTTTETTNTTNGTFSTTPISVTTRAMNNFTELVITGTSGNDSILVTQSGNTITITGNGATTTYTGTFGDLVVHGRGGSDAITIDSSVTLASLLYSDGGSATISARGSGRATIVTIGGGTSTVTGNGVNTSFWVNPGDTVNASSAETAGGRVHRVSAFYQPWTTSTTSPDYVSTQLNGQNLRDPSDSGSTMRLTNRSLFGAGPSMTDVNQGGVGDCYFLADIQSLANQAPERLREMAVDLGDGTYAVQFTRNGVTSFVRVDADVPTGPYYGYGYAYPGASGNIWAPIMEKAYAYYRQAQNTYASLNWGWTGAVFNDLGVANNTVAVSTTGGSTLYNAFSSALNAGKAITLITNSSIVANAPLVGSHAYSLIGVFYDSFGTMTFRLRNPWGVDGAGSDGNAYDGIVQVTLSQLQSNVGYGSMMV